ncbi:CPCC family cysteine-rich protein [Paenibacillus sp. 2RAB27]|uniref:CPCC family cysteine-rich protein n=1 Tax=Paenibacillus sp. 2RAB27 TaxID=3232991 RepID=UPI003F9713EA
MQCPCCDNFTYADMEEAFFEICEVCFWQYDGTAHDKPEKIIGANRISLNQARVNFHKYGVCKEQFKGMVREPLEEELPINNAK